MKLSRYNIEKKEDKSCLIYNTVTSAILELDTDYEKSYYEMKEGKKCSKPDLESALLEGGMLVEDDKDEFAELLIRNKIERFADSNLTLTIAPTMANNISKVVSKISRPAKGRLLYYSILGGNFG